MTSKEEEKKRKKVWLPQITTDEVRLQLDYLKCEPETGTKESHKACVWSLVVSLSHTDSLYKKADQCTLRSGCIES